LNAQRILRDDASSAVFGVAALAVYARLFFGADLTDESFYVALPYSFTLGHRPFVDELAVHQFAALLVRPVVDGYLAVVGSAAGLVLFLRHLYFACSIGCALLFRSYAQNFVGKGPATLLAAISVAYVPFHIPSLSYNTVAYLGLFSGTVLLASACLPGRHSSRLFAGTLLLGVATFAYPTLVVVTIPALALALAAFCLSRDRELWRAALVFVALGGSMAAGWAAWQLVHHDAFAQVPRMLELSDAMGQQGGGSVKLLKLFIEARLQGLYIVLLLLLLAGLASTLLWRPARSFALPACLLLGPALLFIDRFFEDFTEPYTSAPFVFTTIAPAALAFLAVSRRSLPRPHWVSLALVIVPPLLAGAAIAWASANGLRNATLGLMPAALASLMGLGICIPTDSEPQAGAPTSVSPAKPGLAFSLLLTSLLAFQLVQLWTEVYRDSPIVALTEPVAQGAWQGLRTTPRRRELIAGMEEDLERVRGDAESVLFLDYFPAGYLMSDLRPRTPALWLFPGLNRYQGTRALRRIYAQAFEDPQQLPDLVVDMRCIVRRSLEPLGGNAGDPVRKRLRAGRYREQVARGCYRVEARQN